MKRTLGTDQAARPELLQVQAIQVYLCLEFGVGRQHDLKTPIKQKTIDLIGAHTAADTVTGLHQVHVFPFGSQQARTGKSSESTSDHKDRNVVGQGSVTHENILG